MERVIVAIVLSGLMPSSAAVDRPRDTAAIESSSTSDYHIKYRDFKIDSPSDGSPVGTITLLEIDLAKRRYRGQRRQEEPARFRQEQAELGLDWLSLYYDGWGWRKGRQGPQWKELASSVAAWLATSPPAAYRGDAIVDGPSYLDDELCELSVSWGTQVVTTSITGRLIGRPAEYASFLDLREKLRDLLTKLVDIESAEAEEFRKAEERLTSTRLFKAIRIRNPAKMVYSWSQPEFPLVQRFLVGEEILTVTLFLSLLYTVVLLVCRRPKRWYCLPGLVASHSLATFVGIACVTAGITFLCSFLTSDSILGPDRVYHNYETGAGVEVYTGFGIVKIIVCILAIPLLLLLLVYALYSPVCSKRIKEWEEATLALLSTNRPQRPARDPASACGAHVNMAPPVEDEVTFFLSIVIPLPFLFILALDVTCAIWPGDTNNIREQIRIPLATVTGGFCWHLAVLLYSVTWVLRSHFSLWFPRWQSIVRAIARGCLYVACALFFLPLLLWQ